LPKSSTEAALYAEDLADVSAAIFYGRCVYPSSWYNDKSVFCNYGECVKNKVGLKS